MAKGSPLRERIYEKQFVAKFGSVPFGIWENVIILGPSPHIEPLGTVFDVLGLLDRDQKRRRVNCSSRPDQRFADVSLGQVGKIVIIWDFIIEKFGDSRA